MDSVRKADNLSFQGHFQVKTNGYKRWLKTMPVELQQQIGNFRSFVKNELPKDTVVKFDAHNQRRSTCSPDFLRTVKGAKELDDVIFNMHIEGDNCYFGDSGDRLPAIIAVFKKHCSTLGLVKKPN